MDEDFNVPAVVPFDRAPLTAKHKIKILAARDVITHQSYLLPKDLCLRVIAEVEPLLAPAGRKAAARWGKKLMGAYRIKDLNNPEVFATSMAFDLKDFPEDIIEGAVHTVRRKCTFMPTCADVYQAALELMNERQKILRKAQTHLAARDRLDAAERARKFGGSQPPARRGRRASPRRMRELIKELEGRIDLEGRIEEERKRRAESKQAQPATGEADPI